VGVKAAAAEAATRRASCIGVSYSPSFSVAVSPFGSGSRKRVPKRSRRFATVARRESTDRLRQPSQKAKAKMAKIALPPTNFHP
jgi:hypothetical protein